MERIELGGMSQDHGYAVFTERAEFAQGCVDEAVLAGLGNCESASLEVQEGVLALYAPGKLKLGKYRQLRGLASELAEQLAGYNPQTDKN